MTSLAARFPLQGNSHISRHPGHPGRHSSSCTTRRCRLVVKAFRSNDDGVLLPMDAYRVLGVTRTASKESCLKASEQLLANVSDVGYSSELILSRALVLEAATSILTDYTARRAYDRVPQIEIPYAELPGAFVLMQEVGDVQPVITWGRAWLEDNAHDRRARDIALVVALAHSDLAAYWLEEGGRGRVAQASELLAEAHAVLRDFKAAPELQADIRAAHKELQAQVALQLVALDLSEGEARGHGLAALPGVLWQEGAPVQTFPRLSLDRAAYLRELLRHATAAEQVALYAGVPREAVPVKERYAAALACIAEGVTAQKPSLVAAAQGYLHEYREASCAEDIDARDVSMELAVCALLLGRMQAALAELGLAEGSPAQPDPGVRDFVLAHAGESEELLPGLAALAQAWLDDVALPGFRWPAATAPVLLDAWLDSPQVALYLKSSGVLGGLARGVAGVARLLGRGAASLAGVLATTLGRAQGLAAGLVPRAPSDSPAWGQQVAQPPVADSGAASPVLAPSASLKMAGRDSQASAAVPAQTEAAPATSPPSFRNQAARGEAAPEEAASPAPQHKAGGRLKSAVAVSEADAAAGTPLDGAPLKALQQQSVGELVKRYSGEPLGSPGKGAMGARKGPKHPASAPPLIGAAGARAPRPDIDDGVIEAWGAASSLPSSLGMAAPGIIPLDIERDMWMSFAAVRQRRALRAAKIGLAAAALAVGLVAWKKPQALAPANVCAAVTAPGRAAAGWLQETLIPAGEPLAEEAARSLVVAWQDAKARALGAEHAVASLDQVLGERMLQAWRLRAEALQADNRHWRYDLTDVAVDCVETSRDGKRAVVEATLSEGGELVGEDGQVIDSYRATFTQEYELRLLRGRGWRLVGSKLVF